jgi:hypothetical protein
MFFLHAAVFLCGEFTGTQRAFSPKGTLEAFLFINPKKTKKR